MSIKKQQGRKFTAEERRSHHDAMIAAALDLAAEEGYQRVNSSGIAERLGVSSGLVRQYMGSMTQLKRDIMRHAIQREHVAVLAQGLAARDPHAIKAPDALKQRALDSLVGA